MAVNTKTEYALRSLLEIADKGHVSAQKISEAQRLPKKYIEHLLSLLKSAEIVRSSPGSAGGYELNKPADEIKFLDVLRAVKDDSFSASCAHRHGKFCFGQGCTLSPFFSRLESELAVIFESYSLSDIKSIWEGKVI